MPVEDYELRIRERIPALGEPRFEGGIERGWRRSTITLQLDTASVPDADVLAKTYATGGDLLTGTLIRLTFSGSGDALLTENSDNLITESGDLLILE